MEPGEMRRLEQWQHPVTGERATLRHSWSRDLEQRGFVRLTARRPDGSLWLPPTLEPYRERLQASERPVVRLSAEPGREPEVWESKVGGVPYRPRGEAWPVAPDGRPLVFLAQLNLTQLNEEGRNLLDFPGVGVLQFFILSADDYGATVGGRLLSGQQERFRVIYWPEVAENPEHLDHTVPELKPAPSLFPIVTWNAAEERLHERDSRAFGLPHSTLR